MCKKRYNIKTAVDDATLNIVRKTGRTYMHARKFDENDHMRRRQGSLMSPTQQLHNSSSTTPVAGFSCGTKNQRRQRYNKPCKCMCVCSSV